MGFCKTGYSESVGSALPFVAVHNVAVTDDFCTQMNTSLQQAKGFRHYSRSVVIPDIAISKFHCTMN